MKTKLTFIGLYISFVAYSQTWENYGLKIITEYIDGNLYYGIENNANQIVLPAVYYFIESDLSGGYAIVKTSPDDVTELEGIVDSTGKVIVEPKYKSIELPFEDGTVVIEQTEGEYNLMDKQGKLLMAAPSDSWLSFDEFDATEYNYNSKFEVKGKTGIINRHGKIVFPAIFDDIKLTSFPDYLSVKNETGKWGIYSIKNKRIIILCNYESIDPLTTPDNAVIGFDIENNNLNGIIDEQGKILLEPKYSEAIEEYTSNELFAGYIKYFDKNTPLKMGYWVYDLQKHTLNNSQLKYKIVFFSNSAPKALVIPEDNDRYGLMDCINNKFILEPQFDSIWFTGYNIQTSQYFIASKGNQYAVCDFNGKYLLPFGAYDKITSKIYKNNIAIFNVSKNGKWGCINNTGNIIIPIDYESEIDYSDTIWAVKDGKWGCITKDLKEVEGFKYDKKIFNDFDLKISKNDRILNFKIYGTPAKAEYNTLSNHPTDIVESAIKNDSIAVFYYLVNSTPIQKEEALLRAIYFKHVRLFFTILESKPDLKYTDGNTEAPLDELLYRTHYGEDRLNPDILVSMINALAKAGADPNQKSFTGLTPLMTYFDNNDNPDIKVVEALLKAECKVKTKNYYKKDVFDYTSKASKEIKKLLKQYAKNEN